jgi:hypothetical protein
MSIKKGKQLILTSSEVKSYKSWSTIPHAHTSYWVIVDAILQGMIYGCMNVTLEGKVYRGRQNNHVPPTCKTLVSKDHVMFLLYQWNEHRLVQSCLFVQKITMLSFAALEEKSILVLLQTMYGTRSMSVLIPARSRRWNPASCRPR